MHLTLLIFGLILSVTYAYKANDDKKPDKSITTQEIEDEIEEILAAKTQEEQDEFYNDAEKILKTKKDPIFFGRRRRRRRTPSCLGPSRARCNIGLRYNGCGSATFAKVNVNVLHKTTLVDACIKHDICYNCGKYKGWSQEDCDKKFYSDTKAMCKCKSSNFISKGACYASASIMYGAVRAVGHTFYQNSSHDYCDDDACVNQFSPNNNVLK